METNIHLLNAFLQAGSRDSWMPFLGVERDRAVALLTRDLPGYIDVKNTYVCKTGITCDLFMTSPGHDTPYFSLRKLQFYRPLMSDVRCVTVGGIETHNTARLAMRHRGVGTVFLRNMTDFMAMAGIQRFHLMASHPDGIYIWPRRGFAFEDRGERVKSLFDETVPRNAKALLDSGKITRDQHDAVLARLSDPRDLSACRDIAAMSHPVDALPLGIHLMRDLHYYGATLNIHDPAAQPFIAATSLRASSRVQRVRTLVAGG